MITPEAPPARDVLSLDGEWIATYDFGDLDAPAVVLVHGFASSALLNWHQTGWVRDLLRADYRVIALDLRGHGDSSKPHEPTKYSMDLMVADLLAVIDAYMVNDCQVVATPSAPALAGTPHSNCPTASRARCSAVFPTATR